MWFGIKIKRNKKVLGRKRIREEIEKSQYKRQSLEN